MADFDRFYNMRKFCNEKALRKVKDEFTLPGKVTCRKCGRSVPFHQSGTVKVEWVPEQDIKEQIPAFSTAFRTCLHCASTLTKKVE